MRTAAAFVLASAALFAVPAFAADVLKPAPTRVVAAPAPYSWHGCYIGPVVGHGWGDSHWTDAAIGEFSHDRPTGWLAGGTLGCNMQRGALVLGIESDLVWSDITDFRHHVTGDPDEWTDTTKFSAILTIAGRLGVAHDRTLWYAKAGAAGADVTFNDTGENPSGPYEYETSYKRWGYLLGIGAEHALHANWILKVEYNYMNFGSEEVVLAAIDPKPGQPTETFTSKLTLSVIKVGLNYRF